MVKHIILWKLKEEFSEEEKKQIKAGIKEGFHRINDSPSPRLGGRSL